MSYLSSLFTVLGAAPPGGGAPAPKPIGVPGAPKPKAFPGIYGPAKEEQMAGTTTPNGQNLYKQDATGWSLDPSNPANSYENRTSPEQKQWDNDRLAHKPYPGNEPGGLETLGAPELQAAHVAQRSAMAVPRSAPGQPIGAKQALIPDPANQRPQIGVPTPAQSQIGVPTQIRSYGDMNKVVLGGLDRDWQQAAASGNHEQMNHIMAQRAALAQGGILGHQQYMQNYQEHQAAIGAKGRMGNGGAFAGVPRDAAGNLDVEAYRQLGMKETNSADGGDEYADSANIQNYKNQASKGLRVQVEPRLAQRLVDTQSNAGPALARDNLGDPVNDQQEALFSLEKMEPGIFKDPSSLNAQAIGVLMNQMYGNAPMSLPVNPAEDMRPNPKTGFEPADNFLAGMNGVASTVMTGGRNLLDGDLKATFDPHGEYHKRQKANALLKALMNPRDRR